MTDIEIARSYRPLPIQEIAKRVGLSPEELYPYGRYKGKVALSALDRLKGKPQGRYILVTAINPTPLGEGKTTTSIGLAMGLCRIGQRALVTLRQPSLGPVFGIKGGGTGGGHAQVGVYHRPLFRHSAHAGFAEKASWGEDRTGPGDR